MNENNDTYLLEFSVRDYECDLQGIVNNANYQHYFEHARHEYLLSRNVSFSELHNEGIDLIVTRVEIDYKYPLRSRDKFLVSVKTERSGNVRIVFVQEIVRLPDKKLIALARVTGAATKKGKPVSPVLVTNLIGLD